MEIGTFMICAVVGFATVIGLIMYLSVTLQDD